MLLHDMVDILHSFLYTHTFDHGRFLEIRLMDDDKDLECVTELLAKTFIESEWMIPERYHPQVVHWVQDYFKEKANSLPHVATLVAFYKERREEKEISFAGTVEVSFDDQGIIGTLPTPEPPKGCTYICNMSVVKEHRRKGIGWQLLKACEELIIRIGLSKTVYLHCRVVDKGPLALYKKAGYQISKTDSKVFWLMFQPRKHLLKKNLFLGDQCSLNLGFYSKI